MAYYNQFACPYERKLENSWFLIVHAWCFVAVMLEKLLSKYEHFEIASIIAVSRVPLYIWFIYDAHYYELIDLVHGAPQCGNARTVDIVAMWYDIELNVFYGYILSGIIFMFCAKLFDMQTYRKRSSSEELTGKHGDFVALHYDTQQYFSLHTFELVTTLILIVENYAIDELKFLRPGTYLEGMIVLVVYGIVTTAQNFQVFRKWADP